MHVGCVITLAGPPRVYDKTGALLTTVMATRLVPLTPGLALPLFPGCAAVKDQLHVVLDQVGLDAKNVIIGQFQHPVSRAFSYYSTRSGRHGRLLLVAPSCSSTMRLRARKCTSPHATAQAIIRSASSALGAQTREATTLEKLDVQLEKSRINIHVVHSVDRDRQPHPEIQDCAEHWGPRRRWQETLGASGPT